MELLTELRQRLTPGRPGVVIGEEATELSQLAHEMAESLRSPINGSRITPHPVPPDTTPAPISLPSYDVLARAVRAAAEAVPAPAELRRTADFSVRHDVAVAAQDVLALLANQPAAGWTERHDGIVPASHLVSGYRWDKPGGRPIGLAERAAEIRTVLLDTRAPWVPSPADPRPDSVEHSWALLSGPIALVSADLLDELALRLTPGLRTGLVGFDAYPCFELIGRLLTNLTARSLPARSP